MTQTIDQTLAERGARYGDFESHAFITQELKNTLHDNINWHGLDEDMKEALDMIAHKIGRIINGDPQYIDSWTDIIGYTRLVEKRLIDEQSEPSKVKEPEQCDCPICAGANIDDFVTQLERNIADQLRDKQPKSDPKQPSPSQIDEAVELLLAAGVIRQSD